MRDAQLSIAIERLRGEWREVSSGELELLPCEAIDKLPESADVLIFPPRYLGQLCEGQALRPVRDGVLKNSEYKFADIAGAIRLEEIMFGGRVMALPVGSAPALMGWEVAPEDGENLAWRGVLSRKRGGEGNKLVDEFLARGATMAVHPSRVAVLFDPDTMAARITDPPFVRAAEQMFAAEHSASQLIWPTREGLGTKLAAVTRLPGSAEIFDPIEQSWQRVEGAPATATLLATRGAVAAVSAKSRNAAAAFRLVQWLTGPEVSPGLCRASDNLAAVRVSFLRGADDWTGSDNRQLGQQVGQALAATLADERTLCVPRIPGVDEYLKVLEAELTRIAEQQASPPEALRAAAAAWGRLTEKLGREAQRTAYRRSLGLEPYTPEVE